MRSLRCALLLAVVTTMGGCGTASPGEGSLAIHRGDARRTGVLAEAAVPQPTETRWRIDAPVENTRLLAADGRIYFEGIDDRLHAIDAATGRALWTFGDERERHKFDLSTLFSAAPTVADGMVFWADGVQLHALDAETGMPRWTADGNVGGLSPAVSDGVVFFGFVDVRAVAAGTGQERWRYTLGNRVRREAPILEGEPSPAEPQPQEFMLAPPAVSDDAVFIVTAGPELAAARVVALDRTSGQERWSVDEVQAEAGETGDATAAMSVAVRDGRVFVSYIGGLIRVLDAENGRERWRWTAAPEGATFALPVVTSTGVFVAVVVEETTGSIHALDPATGEERWRVDVPGAGELIMAGETLYLGTGAGVHALDPASGRALWLFRSDGPVRAGPLVTGGTLVFGVSGALQAVR